MKISIHALREEGDCGVMLTFNVTENFYPRPPRGGRPLRRCGSSLASRFLSTPSARRATCAHVPLPTLRSNFYPRPPRGGRRENADPGGLDRRISIHALREEGDSPRAREGIEPKNFYPRPPRGGRPPSPTRRPRRRNFYPRPPRGGRQQKQRQNLYFLTNYTTFCTNLEEL